MAERLVSDEFWSRVAPVIPKVERRFRHPGRRRVDDRCCLEAIIVCAEDRLPVGDGTGV
jgi:transposase